MLLLHKINTLRFPKTYLLCLDQHMLKYVFLGAEDSSVDKITDYSSTGPGFSCQRPHDD